jgi:hypothetical protein
MKRVSFPLVGLLAAIGCGGGAGTTVDAKVDTATDRTTDATDAVASDGRDAGSDLAPSDVAAGDAAADGGGDATPDGGSSDLPADVAASDGGGDGTTGADGASDVQRDASAAADVPPPKPYPLFVSGTRLRARYLQAADGTTAQTILHDNVLDTDCSFELMENGVTRCVPTNMTYVVFADAQCKVPVAERSCAAAKWARYSDESGSHVYKLGAAVAKPTTIYLHETDENGQPTCRPSPTPPYASETFVSAAPQADTMFVATTGQALVEAQPDLRLAGRYLVGADGSKARVGIEDTALGGTCDVLGVEGGARRCFTRAQPVSMIHFGDDQCTTQLLLATTAATPIYARASRLPTGNEPRCGAVWSLRKVGAKHVGGTYRRNGNGTACIPSTLPGGTTPYTITAGDESAQVLVTLTDDLRGGTRLRAVGTRGADGSVFDPSGDRLIDTRFGETCAVASAAGGQRCLPPWDGTADAYADAACSMLAYRYPDETCTRGSAATAHYVAYQNDRCGVGDALKVFARGAAVPTPYDKGATTCTAFDASSSIKPGGYYQPGAEVPLTEFVAIESKLE